MKVQLENEKLRLAVKEDGAELTELYHKSSGSELLWRGEPAVWGGQSPVLFPIVGRLWQDCYQYQGQTYSLKKHGFARNSRFILEKKEENELLFVLRDSQKTRLVYPFSFALGVRFRLENCAVSVSYEVENTDDKTLYFSVGGHPGFDCRMGDRLVFEAKEPLNRLCVNADGYLTKETELLSGCGEITITPELFLEDALIFEGLKSHFVRLEKQSEKPDIQINFGKKDYLGIWAKPAAPYVCIEPWVGINDACGRTGELAQKPGILSLEPEQKFCFSYDILVLEK